MATIKEMEYWLRGRHDDVRMECIEIKHPSFSRDYRFVRNHAYGVRIKHEDGVYRDYEPLPMTIKAAKAAADLQQSFTIGIGDVGEVMPLEIDRLRRGSHQTKRPILNYRVYLTSDLTSPMSSARGLEITNNQPQKQGAVFTCQGRELNKTSTGIIFTVELLPSLRGV